jgi:hypothetical protein
MTRQSLESEYYSDVFDGSACHLGRLSKCYFIITICQFKFGLGPPLFDGVEEEGKGATPAALIKE